MTVLLIAATVLGLLMVTAGLLLCIAAGRNDGIASRAEDMRQWETENGWTR